MTSFNDLSNAIRFLSIDAVNAANSGHPGMPMGMADIMTVLYRDFLRFNPEEPNWPARDRLVLSNGHGSMLLYSLLHLTGYDVSLKDLKNFRQMGSKTAGHPEYGHCVGVETTTGPLGQGVANAVGMAIAQKKHEARHGDLMSYKIYTTVGDGCLMEGISHEACELAGAQQLNNLILLFDDNNISIDGEISITSKTDVTKRFESYGFNVLSADGHDEHAIHRALTEAQTSDKPVLIRFKTSIGYGSPAMAGTAKAHGSPLGSDERAQTASALKWEYAEFDIPEKIYTSWRSFTEKSQKEFSTWQNKLEQNDTSIYADDLSNNQAFMESINSLKQEVANNSKAVATRKAFGHVLSSFQDSDLISGSADLTGSVNTLTKSMTALTSENPDGNFIHYGVREHAMAAVMNGLALSGFAPTSGTFLAFADYMKPSMRLSSLMRLPVLYILTHDSIGLGEDGPTHQPVEQLSMLRSMPNFNVFRPCDLTETAECWQLARTSKKTPSGMILSRQTLPALRISYTEDNLCSKGAYVLKQEKKGQPLDAIFLASGSEVHLAIEAAKELASIGENVRVVSVPCMDLFLKQPKEYQKDVLPHGVKRIAIEAAARQSWDRFLCDEDVFIGMDDGQKSHFGGSAPASELYEQFGITVDTIVNSVK